MVFPENATKLQQQIFVLRHAPSMAVSLGVCQQEENPSSVGSQGTAIKEHCLVFCCNKLLKSMLVTRLDLVKELIYCVLNCEIPNKKGHFG